MRAPGLSITLQESRDGNVLRVSGEIDLATGPEFARRLREALRPDRGLIVDLQDVPYIDVRGIKTLEAAAARAAAAGQRFVVVSSSRQFHRVCELLDLRGGLELVRTMDEGLPPAAAPRPR